LNLLLTTRVIINIVIEANRQVRMNLFSFIKNDKKPFEKGEMENIKSGIIYFSQDKVNKLVTITSESTTVLKDSSKLFSLIMLLAKNKHDIRKMVCNE